MAMYGKSVIEGSTEDRRRDGDMRRRVGATNLPNSLTSTNEEGTDEVEEATLVCMHGEEDKATEPVPADKENVEQISARTRSSEPSRVIESLVKDDGTAYLPPVQVVETTEELMVVSLRGCVQEYLLKALSSIVASDVKDVSREGNDLVFGLEYLRPEKLE